MDQLENRNSVKEQMEIEVLQVIAPKMVERKVVQQMEASLLVDGLDFELQGYPT